VEITALRAIACSDQRPCRRLGKCAYADAAPAANGRVGRYCFHDSSVRYSKRRNRCQSEHSIIFCLAPYFLRASAIMANSGLHLH
jgi:hypothetical protein